MKFPRWLSWVFVLFLVYIIYTGNRVQQPAAPEPTSESASSQTPHDYPAIDALMNGDRWKHALNPTATSPDTPCAPLQTPEGSLANYAIIDHPGSGDGAACGDSITLRMTYWNPRGQVAHTAEITLVLGEQKSLDALLVGIASGESRTLLLRPAQTTKTLPALKKDLQQIVTVERIEPMAIRKSQIR